MRALINRYEGEVLGLPEDGRFVPVTNTTASRMTCLRRWWFSEVEGLARPVEGNALDRGSSWDLLIEDVYRWWEVTDQPYPEANLDSCGWCKGAGRVPAGTNDSRSVLDPGVVTRPCEHCHGTGDGVLSRALAPWYAALEDDPPPFGPDDVEREELRLRRAFRGYVEVYEARPMQHFRIVGTQVRLARPVLNPATGKSYRPDTLLVRTDVGWIRAGTSGAMLAEAGGAEVRRVNWPIYQLGALDAVAADRSTGAGWVIDAKFSGNLRSYVEKLQIDPQLPGYCWLLDAHREPFGLTSVAGMMYDLTSSRLHSEPYALKWKPPLVREMKALAEERGVEIPKGTKADGLQALLGIEEGHGGYSTSESKLAGVPSWMLREAVERAAEEFPNDVDPDDYEEAIEWCAGEVDPGLYMRPWRNFTDEDLARYAHEIFGKARTVAALHRAAVRVRSPRDLDVSYPRTPVCTLPGGSCPYRAPCANDSEETRDTLSQRDLVVWTDSTDAVDNPETDTVSDVQKELGF